MHDQHADANEDDETGNEPVLEKPLFKHRDRHTEVIESGNEWDTDVIEADEAMIEAVEYFGPAAAADILVRHWVAADQPQLVLQLADQLLSALSLKLNPNEVPTASNSRLKPKSKSSGSI